MTVVADVLLVAGAALIALAAIGLHRFGDFYSRTHSASKATSAGFLLVALGTAIHLGGVAGRVEVALATMLLLATTPVGVHLLVRAAYRTRTPPPENLAVDELAEDGGRSSGSA